MSTTNRVEEIRQEIANLEGELSTLAGEGLRIEDSNAGRLHDRPRGGATLTVDWCTDTHCDVTWYPTVEQALAALSKVAGRRPLERGGWAVDLTAPGCLASQAFVTRHDDDLPPDAPPHDSAPTTTD